MRYTLLKQGKRFMAIGLFSCLLATTPYAVHAQDGAVDVMNDLQEFNKAIGDLEQATKELENLQAELETMASEPEGELTGLGDVFDALEDEANTDEEDVYFDSVQPVKKVLQDVAPIEVDPRKQPGQSFILVEKHSEAGGYESQIVAANRALKLGRFSSALSMFETLHEQNPRDPRVLMGLAVSQQKSGFRASAINSYEKLLEQEPQSREAQINLLGLIKNQNPDKALTTLMKMHKDTPHDPGVAAQIGMTYAKIGRYKEARKYLGIATSLDPNNAVHIFNIAIANDRLGNKSDAIDLYEQALKVDAMHGASRSIPRQSVYDRLSDLRRL